MTWEDETYADLQDVRLFYRRAGHSPRTLVLLHGWPQTGLCWRHVVPLLAEHFTVVVPDLRGYGDSGLSPTGYDKRATARDLSHLIQHLGGGPVLVAGHDRGARVAHRWALDRPDDVISLALLDILPTREVMRTFDLGSAQAMWHWLFHLQPGLPELLIRDRTEEYLRHFLAAPVSKGAIDDATFRQYVEAFRDPDHLAATLEDYRAGFGVDLERDDADYARGRSITQPLLALWGADGGLGAKDVVGVWKRYAGDVRGLALRNCGHYLPEEQPARTAEALLEFFGTSDVRP